MTPSTFIRGLLDDQEDPQLPQYDPEGGWNTAKNAGSFLASLTTPGAMADAAGYLGGPSAVENVKAGNYGDAALQALGLIPGAGLLGKVAGGAKLAMAVPAAAKSARAPRKLTEAAKAAEGGENLFDFSRLSEVPNVPQSDVQRYVPPRGGTGRVNDFVANPDVREKMLGIIEEGRKMGGPNWYNAEPLREAFVNELGSGGDDAFNKYMDFVAASSPRSDVGTNARNASFYYHRLMSGQGLPEVGTRNPAPYGHLAQKNHQSNALAVAGDGWDPLQNPKPASFAQNLMGNQQPVTVDTHAFRAPAIFSADPRFLATSYKPSKDAVPINYQKLLSSGEKTMDELVNTPVAWDAMPKKTEYGAMENYYKDLAREAGMTPAQAQASAWVGGSAHTGLMSDESKPFLQFLQDRIHLTAQKHNMDPKDVLSEFIRGKIPLLSVGGLGLLGASSLPQDQTAAPEM